MTDGQEMLIRGSDKVIVDYQLLRVGAQTEKERKRYLRRRESERLAKNLKNDMPRRIAA